MSSFCLGTANIGLDNYGVNNQLKADKTRAFEVLQAAYDCGVRWIDTAAAYGQAEEWIAEWAPDDVRVVTKSKVYRHARIHPWTTLFHGDDLPTHWAYDWDGASVYTLAAGDKVAVEAGAVCTTPVLQVPLNVYQMGFWTSGIIQKALANDVTVFARSVFAQGYLLNRNYTIEACINAVRYLSADIIPVIGCDTPEQVNEIAEVFK